MGLHKDLFIESNPIPVKWAPQAMGLVRRGIRLPLTPLAERHHETVRQGAAGGGVIDMKTVYRTGKGWIHDV